MNDSSEDAFIAENMKVEDLKKRLEEIEYAIQKSETKSLPLCEQAEDGKTVGSRNPKGKASKKNKA